MLLKNIKFVINLNAYHLVGSGSPTLKSLCT